MPRRRLAGFLAAILLVYGLSANDVGAQARVLQPQWVSGIDGLISQCVTLTKDQALNAMCDSVIGQLETMAAERKLEHRHLGIAQWAFGSDEYLEAPADLAFENPVWLTLTIRGTRNPESAMLWASLYFPQEDGRLVVWEDSGVAAAPDSSIFEALAAGFAAAKLTPIVQVLAEAAADE